MGVFSLIVKKFAKKFAKSFVIAKFFVPLHCNLDKVQK